MIPVLFFAVTAFCAVMGAIHYTAERYARALLYVLVGGCTAFFAIATLPTAFGH
jgi:hypothetical protein